MGLTNQSTGLRTIKGVLDIKNESSNDIVISLAGNPNTGKSTVFNNLTGLKQHTGNWPGKTVLNAQGNYNYNERNYILVDLPGAYSLLASSAEEEVARDFICFGNPNATVVVTDATCLERNLNLVLQVIEITNNVVVCVNLLDEAKKKKIEVDIDKLSHILGVPVVGTSARDGIGLEELKRTIEELVDGNNNTKRIMLEYNTLLESIIKILEPIVEEIVDNKINSRWVILKIIEGDKKLLDSLGKYLHINFNEELLLKSKLDEIHEMLKVNNITLEDLRDQMVNSIVLKAEEIARNVVTTSTKHHNELDRKIDKILTSKIYGIPIMIALLGMVFWITIEGANIPSGYIAQFLFWIEEKLINLFVLIGTPKWIHELFVLGMYRTLAWVVSVMLPPMAIFFPLFTLLEDLGYLPRIAFNLDYYFKKACTHGKQALTMCMGFGCNAAGVIACRIIDSPRERLIATITNNFLPCNGRFPTLIALATIFIVGNIGAFSSIAATLVILGTIILGIIITLLVSKILSKTILKGLPSSFTLELPPYRKPQIGKVIVRSLFDRTLFVLGRAVSVAAPAGLFIWFMANTSINGISILTHCSNVLDPFGRIIGMDGYIMMAFILGLPANEIVIPILIMSYMATGSILELDSLNSMGQLFRDHGWTTITAICMMLFSLNHWPCATTLWTIRKETQSWKWTIISFLVPTIIGIILCLTVVTVSKIFGLL